MKKVLSLVFVSIFLCAVITGCENTTQVDDQTSQGNKQAATSITVSNEVIAEKAIQPGRIKNIIVYNGGSEKEISDPNELIKAASMLDKLTVGNYETIGNYQEYISFTVYYDDYTSKRIELYDDQYLAIFESNTNAYTRKIIGGNPKDLKIFLHQTGTEIEQLKLTKQFDPPSPVQNTISKKELLAGVQKNMNFRNVLTCLGKGEYSYDALNRYCVYTFYLEPINPSARASSIVFCFRNLNDVINLSGTQLVNAISGGQRFFRFGSVPNYSVSTANGRAVVLSYSDSPGQAKTVVCDLSLRPLVKQNFRDCQLYKNCFTGSKDGKTVLYDYQGNQLLSGESIFINDFGRGIVETDKRDYYLINEKGQKIDNIAYEFLFLNDNNTFEGHTKENKYRLVDSNGKVIINQKPENQFEELKNGKVIYHYIMDKNASKDFSNLLTTAFCSAKKGGNCMPTFKNYEFAFDRSTSGANMYILQNSVYFPNGGINKDGSIYSIYDTGSDSSKWSLSVDLGQKIRGWINKNKASVISVSS